MTRFILFMLCQIIGCFWLYELGYVEIIIPLVIMSIGDDLLRRN